MADGLPDLGDGPSAMDLVAQALDPDRAIPGLLVVDGDDLPDDAELGRQVRTKLLSPSGHLKPSVLKPRRIVVVDRDQPERVPEVLLEGGQARKEWIEGCETDIILNLLNTPDDAELGRMVREYLLEDEKIHNPDYYPSGGEDSDEPHSIPGYYDSSDGNEPRSGEQRAWAVVGGS